MTTKRHGEDAQLKVRIEPELRRQIEEAAHARGVSLNREIVDRLAKSFSDYISDDRLAQGGFAQYGAAGAPLQLAAEAMWLAGTQAAAYSGASNWFDDPYAYDQATKAASGVLQAFRPEGDVGVPRQHRRAKGFSAESRVEFLKYLHEVIVLGMLEHIAEGKLGSIGAHRRSQHLLSDLEPLRSSGRLKLPKLIGDER